MHSKRASLTLQKGVFVEIRCAQGGVKWRCQSYLEDFFYLSYKVYAESQRERPSVLPIGWNEAGANLTRHFNSLWPGRLLARISLFQSEERGSKPLRATILQIVILNDNI